MINQSNPYCAVPFYRATYHDAGVNCPINSPTRRLPMFQVEVEDTVVSGDAVAYLENVSTGAQIEIPGIEVFNADNGNAYITYPGTELTLPAAEGMYRVRIEGEDLTLDYLSHQLCLSKVYDPQDWEAQVDCIPSGDDFGFTVSFDNHPGLPTEIEVNYLEGSGWQRLSDGLNENPARFLASLAPLNSVKLRLKVWLDDALFYKDYTYLFDPESMEPCLTGDLTFTNVGGEGYERFLCLEWQNTKDLQTLGLMYSGVQGDNGFLQQFYFEGWSSMAGVVAEETFLKNGLGVSVLDSIEIARLYNVQFYPLPDALIAPLRAANAHNVRALRQVADSLTYTTSNIGITPEEVTGTPCAKGTFTIELNRALVGCQDNLTAIE